MNNYDNEINGVEFVMKRLIFFIFIVLSSTILYTCASPLAVEGLPFNNATFYSKPIISSSSATTHLGVQVSARQIQIGFASGSITGGTITYPASITGAEPIDNSNGTNIISGTYPIINFQNGVMSGTITFIDENELKITFQQHNSPYFKMWDVICSTSSNP